MSDHDDFRDEYGDTSPILLESNPLKEIPADELLILGEMIAWATFIEVDIFVIYVIGNPGDAVKRRKEFYKKTAGLHKRVQLVRSIYKDKLSKELIRPFENLMSEVEALAQLRNDWAHNPIIIYGPKRTLARWQIGSGEYAGNLVRVDASVIRPLMPDVAQLHINLQNLAALLKSPEGSSFAVSFGEEDERTRAQIARLLKHE